MSLEKTQTIEVCRKNGKKFFRVHDEKNRTSYDADMLTFNPTQYSLGSQLIVLKELSAKVTSQELKDGCGRQFYYGTQLYPDHTCIDGNLWDDDDCDHYLPDCPPACPFCKPEEYEDGNLEEVKALEYEATKSRRQLDKSN